MMIPEEIKKLNEAQQQKPTGLPSNDPLQNAPYAPYVPYAPYAPYSYVPQSQHPQPTHATDNPYAYPYPYPYAYYPRYVPIPVQQSGQVVAGHSSSSAPTPPTVVLAPAPAVLQQSQQQFQAAQTPAPQKTTPVSVQTNINIYQPMYTQNFGQVKITQYSPAAFQNLTTQSSAGSASLGNPSLTPSHIAGSSNHSSSSAMDQMDLSPMESASCVITEKDRKAASILLLFAQDQLRAKSSRPVRTSKKKKNSHTGAGSYAGHFYTEFSDSDVEMESDYPKKKR